jgi:predicted RNA-binding Zn ribbon-like protein
MVTQPAPPLYDPCGGHPALDFVNSISRSVGKPWVERLVDYEAFLRWCTLAETLPRPHAIRLSSAAQAAPQKAAAALTRARALREAAYRIYAALAEGETPARSDLDVLNAELSRALAHAKVELVAGGFAWKWDEDPDELDSPLWPLARAAAELLISPERSLVKRCASATCLWLFLDRTKNHARRWCDMKVCGNRDKVRRHRRRARARPLRPRARQSPRR